jgi:hypothetical protein
MDEFTSQKRSLTNETFKLLVAFILICNDTQEQKEAEWKDLTN